MDDFYFDEEYFDDYGWSDLEAELQQEDQQRTLVNNLDYRTFKRLNDKEKIDYLYHKISDLYSYLLTIQDVVSEGD